MITINYRKGSDAPLAISVSDDGTGSPVDTKGFEIQLRMDIQGACVVLDSVLEDDLYIFDLNKEDFQIGGWITSIYYRSLPQGWTYADDFVLVVMGGC